MEEYTPDNDNKDLVTELIKKATDKKHSKFEFIRSYEMLIAARAMKKASKLIYKSFHSEAKAQYNEYIKEMKAGFDDVQKLVNSRHYFDFADFYKTESYIFDNMIYEFCCFCQWRPLTFLGMWLFGDTRREEDCRDYSGSGFEEDR